MDPCAFCSETNLDECIPEVASLLGAYKTMADSRDYDTETRAERIENDYEMANAKYDLRVAQEKKAKAAMRHADLELELASLHLQHILLKVHGPKCEDWSAEAKQQLIADAEVPVAEAKEKFAASRLKLSR